MNTLFELRTEDDLRREAVADNANRVYDVVMGRGPFELSDAQRRLLECLRGRNGRLQAITIDELQRRVGSTPRGIKADVRELVVTFKLPIVASRDGETGGYFFAVSAEERISGTADYIKEILALAERVRVVRNLPDLNALWGQLNMQLDISKGDAQ
jgi:hypothetical protein